MDALARRLPLGRLKPLPTIQGRKPGWQIDSVNTKALLSNPRVFLRMVADDCKSAEFSRRLSSRSRTAHRIQNQVACFGCHSQERFNHFDRLLRRMAGLFVLANEAHQQGL